MNQITVTELSQWRQVGKEYQIIDVREPIEHNAYSIGGELIPLGTILQNIDKIETDKPVIFYCKKGIRSQIAIQKLAQKCDTSHFYNLTGGILHLFY